MTLVRSSRADAGQATVLVAAVIVVVVTAVAALALVGGRAVDDARAQAAADAVALAAAEAAASGWSTSADAASRLASRNGVRLVSVVVDGGDVVVVVDRDGVTATARASAEP